MYAQLHVDINARECFKLKDRENIEFCLKEKTPGLSFVEAAK